MVLKTLEGSKDSAASSDSVMWNLIHTSQETVEEGAVELLGDHLLISSWLVQLLGWDD